MRTSERVVVYGFPLLWSWNKQSLGKGGKSLVCSIRIKNSPGLRPAGNAEPRRSSSVRYVCVEEPSMFGEKRRPTHDDTLQLEERLHEPTWREKEKKKEEKKKKGNQDRKIAPRLTRRWLGWRKIDIVVFFVFALSFLVCVCVCLRCDQWVRFVRFVKWRNK